MPQVGHVIDLMPTLLEVAGVEYPREYQGREVLPMAGRSLAGVLRTGQTIDREPIFWEHEGNRAVRRGSWKLVSEHLGPWELYDLSRDRTELNNVAAAHPELVKELTGLYDQWAQASNVRPWPLPKLAR